MKITKTSDRAAWLREQERIGNLGCNKCPCCGEPYTGIPPIKTWAEGFFTTKHYKVKCYVCRSCGVEWESDPYIWA